jgi:hypothetical protein
VPDPLLAISFHAAESLEERAIAMAWVERVVLAPQWLEPDRDDPELLHALGRIPEHGDRVLRVIYNDTVRPRRLVTAYFDRTQRHRR